METYSRVYLYLAAVKSSSIVKNKQMTKKSKKSNIYVTNIG